ncbi:hypothetical protein TNCV_2343661 [Trichonephila clavipes]|nr:hypothetical protein TNCV_2343661 [Trichonephila clavipes]
MDCEVLNENKCFTVTWKIENFSYFWQKNGECFKSPVFVADTMGKSKWRLSLYPKGDRENEKDFICFYLTREDCNEWGNLDINFQLSFLATDDSVLISGGRNYKSSFLLHKSWGFHKFVKCEEVLKIRRKDYLSKNVLTARCRMRENNGVIDYGHCFAWTRIAVERRSFVWNIKQFSSFQESVCEIPSTSAEQSMIKLKFFPSLGQNSETIIRVKFCDHIQSLKILTFRIHLVDISENRVECVSGEIVFKADIENTSFTLTFSKEELMKNKNRYLPSDVLQLHCECFFSNGIMLEEIKYFFGCPLSIQKEIQQV